jgi:hypothetical protein
MTLTFVGLAPQTTFAAASSPAYAPVAAAAQPQDPRSRRSRGARVVQTPEQVLEAARPLAVTTGISCDVTEAKLLGTAEDGSSVYETTCRTGPGFLLQSKEPPTAINCLALNVSVQRAREANPEVPPASLECTMPANVNATAVLTPLAQAAGVTCTIDDAGWIGETTDGKDRYEIGCAGADGYWLEVPKAAGGQATLQPCLLVVNARGTCARTSAEEHAAVIGGLLAGQSAPSCTVSGGRYAGQNANGKFYEARCADDSGFMFRTSAEGAFLQAYPCATAQSIGGGCTLTDTSAITAAADQRRMSLLAQAGLSCAKTQERRIGAETSGLMREAIEYGCSDQPLGLVLLMPAEGADGFEAIDCVSAAARRMDCRFVTADAVKEAVGRQMQAARTSCTVAEFRGVGRIVEAVAERFEVKCADGSGYIVDVPADRAASAQVKTCATAANEDDRCEL